MRLMYLLKWFLFLYGGCFVGAACHRDNPILEIIPLVKVVKIGEQQDRFSVNYPGVLRAATDVKLAFRVAGPIQRVFVREGEFVRKGKLLAVLDPRDYQLQYDAARAQYEQVKEESDRIIELYRRKSVSVNEYDKAVAGQKQAWALYQARLNALEDTRLRAPFDGYVQKKYFDDYEIVNQGIPVLTMVSDNALEVDIDIPASDYIRRSEFKNFYAVVDVYPDHLIPLEFLYLNQQANFNQLFKARFRLKQQPDLKLASGMSASVIINYESSDQHLLVIPVSALFQEDKRSYVWRINEHQQRISKTPVEVRQVLKDGQVIVASRLQIGDQIVAVGVNDLKEGQKVKILPPPSSSNVGHLL